MSYLDEAHIAQSEEEGVEYHPFRPFLPEGCKVLFLGSFPPPRRRWCQPFYYPNFQNDFWRIIGALFRGDPAAFVDVSRKTFRTEALIECCAQEGIGFYDTAVAIRRGRGNASDKDLEVVEPTDVSSLLVRIPSCRVIATTGMKATATLCATFHIPVLQTIGTSCLLTVNAHSQPVYLYRLPSTSRAYCAASLSQKTAFFQQLFAFARA